MRYVAEQIRVLPPEDASVQRQISLNQQQNEQRQIALDAELAQAETAEDMCAIAEIAELHERAMQLDNATVRDDFQAASVARVINKDRLCRTIEEELCPGPRPIKRYRWFGKVTGWACGSAARQQRLSELV